MGESQDLRIEKERLEAVKTALEERDIILHPRQIYSGPGIAKLLGRPEDNIYSRLGRRHFGEYTDFRFNKGSIEGRPFAEFVYPDYSILIPLTPENTERIIDGRKFQYFIFNGFKEDPEGFIIKIDPNQIEREQGGLEDLVRLMPKKRIPNVSSVNVIIGDKKIPNVLSSNPDDNGEVIINSTTGHSSVLYNPDEEEPPQPLCPKFGSDGWLYPTQVRVVDNQLFFREPNDDLWELKFNQKGYRAIKVPRNIRDSLGL